MAVELASAYVSIIPSTKGIKGQLERELGGPAAEAGESAGGRFGSAFGGVASKALKVGAAGVAAGFGAALVKGFGRLQAIDDARFKLQGLGHDATAVDTIMESALASVKGTAFGLGDAASIAAGAVAAGIAPGEDLTRVLSLTGDAASIAGVSLGEMGSIFGKVAAGNRMMTEEMNQLTDRGLPVLQWLQDEYNVTADVARDMVSSGQVDFATFSKIIEDNIGGAALTAGESFGGALANVGAAVGRFGAALLGPAFSRAPEIFGSITAGIDRLTNGIDPAIATVKRFETPIKIVSALIGAVFIPHFVALGVAATASAVKQAAAWVVTQAGAVKAAAVHSAQVAKMVARWVFVGVQSLFHAGKVALAWLIAMGPIALVIAAVVGLVVLIVKNWDTIKRVTVELWNKFTDWTRRAWAKVTETISSGISKLVTWFKELPGRIIGALGNFGRMLYNTGRDMIQGLIDGAKSLLRNIGKFFLDLVPGWIRGPLEKALGISSPSKVGRSIGENFMESITAGVAANVRPLASVMGDVAGAMALDAPSLRLPPAAVRGGDGAGMGSAAAGGGMYVEHLEVNYPEPEPAGRGVREALIDSAFLLGRG